MLQKCVYLYENMDDQKKFKEKSLPKKRKFYSSLNIENITATDYEHENYVQKKSAIKFWQIK